jgi:hypothetical protein
MELRQLKQYGWISGPVECRCTSCDWSTTFTAVDSSTPAFIANAYAEHDCSEHSDSMRSHRQVQVSATNDQRC